MKEYKQILNMITYYTIFPNETEMNKLLKLKAELENNEAILAELIIERLVG